MEIRTATVFGGSGFIGRQIVRELAKTDASIRIAVRHPERALSLKPCGDVGQIVPMLANLRDAASVRAAVEGADVVVNLVGILYERGAQRFEAVHRGGCALVAAAASEYGVRRLIHFSAIGASPHSQSIYARTKAEGERAVREAFPSATIFRPSLVFGPEDNLFNRFAAMSRLSPFLPLIGGGTTRFQPVFVGDVADAVIRALDDPRSAAQTYELGGPKIYSFKELMQVLLAEIRRKRLLVPVPFPLAFALSAVLGVLPKPILTWDQVRQLQWDNIVARGANGLAELGVTPTTVEVILPTYLDRYRRGGPRVIQLA